LSETVEHPFRHHEDAHGRYALPVQDVAKVATGMALCVLTCNLTRVLNIVGVEKMLEAIAA